MNVLFVCSQNRLRSPTAEQVFATWPGVETSSAGLAALLQARVPRHLPTLPPAPRGDPA